eukprot:s2252_g18.t1
MRQASQLRDFTHGAPLLCHGDGGLEAMNAEDDLQAEVEIALAAAMTDPDLSQGDYYDLCARLPSHCWGYEFISPKPGVLQNCCFIPKIGAMGLIGRCVASFGADVVLSIGSGAGLLEWLLSPRFNVICVDYFYTVSDSGA